MQGNPVQGLSLLFLQGPQLPPRPFLAPMLFSPLYSSLTDSSCCPWQGHQEGGEEMLLPGVHTLLGSSTWCLTSIF